MKSTLLVSLCLAALVCQGYSQVNLTNGLYAHYLFDGNANDVSGNSRNGVASNVTAVPNRFGASATAFDFNGANSVVTVTPLSSANLTSMTLSVWVKPTAAPSSQGFIINKWAAFKLSNADWSFDLRSDMRVTLVNYDHVSAQGALIATSNALPLGQWSHIVGTIENDGKATVWVNGVLEGQGVLYAPVTASDEPVRIGQMVSGSGGVVDSFDGSIDDIRIYSRVLSNVEIQGLYSLEQTGVCVARRAAATATVVNGFVVGGVMTDSGGCYTNVPDVKVIGTGVGATAVATLENGKVTGITIINPGSGYGTNTVIRIASPPFIPWLDMSVSKVKVTQHIVLGRNYILESSTNCVDWAQVGGKFTAEDETIVQEFDVDVTGRYFRLQQVP